MIYAHLDNMEGKKRKFLLRQKNVSVDDGIFMSSSNENLSERSDTLTKVPKRARPPKLKKRNVFNGDSGFADGSLSVDSISKAELPSILHRPIDISRGSSVDPEDYSPDDTNLSEKKVNAKSDVENAETAKSKKGNKLRRAYTVATAFMSSAWKGLEFGELLVGPDFPPVSHRGSYDMFEKKFSCNSGTDVDAVVSDVKGSDYCDLGTSVDGDPEISRTDIYEERGRNMIYLTL